MKTIVPPFSRHSLTVCLLLLGINLCLAQVPQDNWYLWQTWTNTGGNFTATNGGLSSPYGVAIGPDGRIYVGDQGYKCIQVYLPNGAYSFSITNGFGGGLKFSQPRGMITDTSSNLYVADVGTNCVYVFGPSGNFLRKIGSGTGSGNGQLKGVVDVAVSSAGLVYVLEVTNSRLSVFNADGSFNKILISSGVGFNELDGQLFQPASIAVSPSGNIYVADDTIYIKAFDTNGLFLNKTLSDMVYVPTGGVPPLDSYSASPYSIRFDPSGLLHEIICYTGVGLINWNIYNSAFEQLTNVGAAGPFYRIIDFSGQGLGIPDMVSWPCHAIGPDGTMIICGHNNKTLQLFRLGLREQWAPPRNCIPMPAIIDHVQRPNSPLVDIDYQVTDLDNSNVFVGMMVFTNAVQSLSNCIPQMTLAEGTATNLGWGIAANQPHHVTWNAGADWAVSLGNYRIALLAKDNRQGLLDIHYLTLPASRGMPSLKISASPLIQSDFQQVWWWLLATNDPGIMLNSGNIYGVGGSFDTQLLCNGDYNTTTNGMAYIFAKMNVRLATAQEVQWASEGAVAGNTNQWTPTMVVGGRPMAVNEYGFDTGNWGPNAWWVVPQN